MMDPAARLDLCILYAMEAGLDIVEIAATLGVSIEIVDRIVDDLRAERCVHGTDEEFARAAAAIADHGRETLEVAPGTIGGRLAPIESFDLLFGHCDPEAIVAIGNCRPGAKGQPEGPRWLLPVRVRDLRGKLPGIFDYETERTQYLAANPFNDNIILFGKYGRPVKNPLTCDERYRLVIEEGKPPPYFFKSAGIHGRNVHQLASLCIDLDCYQEPDPIGPGAALGIATDMAREGRLPFPSMGTLSGRGCYLWWLLRADEYRNAAPVATRDAVYLWKQISTELRARLANLKADKRAKEVVNWYKRAGTIDVKTDSEVVYMILGVPRLSGVPRYTLQGMATSLRLYLSVNCDRTHWPSLPDTTIDLDRKRAPRIRRVQAGKGAERYQKTKHELMMIAIYREGIFEGCRSTTLLHYTRACFQAAHIIERAANPNDPKLAFRCAFAEARSAAHGFNATHCKPPLPSEEVEKAICLSDSRDAEGRRLPWKPHAATIADEVGVTVEEARAIGLEMIAPREWRESVKAAYKAVSKADREARHARTAAIQADLRAGELSQAAIAREHGVRRQRVHTIKREMEATAGPSKPATQPAREPPSTPSDTLADDRQGWLPGVALDSPQEAE